MADKKNKHNLDDNTTIIEGQEKLSVESEKSENKFKKGILIILLLLLVIPTYGMLKDAFNKKQPINGANKPPLFGTEVDKDSEKGGVASKEQEEIQAELNAKVEASMINISMNLTPVFKDGKSKGNLLIVNEEVNNYMQVIEIYRDDTNELIYTSGGIPVGSKIEMAKLDKELAKGNYECTAFFNAVDSETGELIGKAGAKITVSIQN